MASHMFAKPGPKLGSAWTFTFQKAAWAFFPNKYSWILDTFYTIFLVKMCNMKLISKRY